MNAVHAFVYRTVPTTYGPRMYTDVCFVFMGQFYGARYHGALSKQDMAAESGAFLRRRQKEQEDGA